MTDCWDFYFCRIDDQAASVFLNLSARDAAPDPSRTIQLVLRIPMLHPREDGLSSSDEANALFALEDAVLASLTPFGVRHVGRTTTGGARMLYYYCASDQGIASAASLALKRFPNYRPDVEMIADPDWDTYLTFLYPKPTEKRQIDNRAVVEALEKHGDPLTPVRDIRHFLYFPTLAQREGFLQAISLHGFRAVEGSSRTAAGGTHRFEAQIQRDDAATWNQINEVTTLIADAAEPFEGDYDGWEAQVVTLPPPTMMSRVRSLFHLRDA